MIDILLVLVILLFLFTYYNYNNQLLAPPVILCLVYIISIGFAKLNVDKWKVDLSLETVTVIFTGLLVFCITSIIIRRNYRSQRTPILLSTEEIKVSGAKYYLALIITFLCTILILKSIGSAMNISAFSGGDEYVDAMAEYRSEFSYGSESLPFYVNQLNKVLNGLSFVFLYIFCFNFAISNKFLRNLKYLIPTIAYAYISLRSGSRTSLIILATAGLVFFYIVKLKSGEYKKGNFKLIIYIVLGSITFLWFFSYIRSFVGRKNETDLISYIATYGGGSIQLLDIYLNSPKMASNNFGQETFAGFYNNLAKLGIGKKQIMHMEFRESNGFLLGNIYTAFRAYIQDFGYMGMICIQVFLSYFYTKLYEIVLHKDINYKKYSLSFLIYGMLMMPLFEHSIQEQLLRNYFAFNTVVTIIILAVFSYYFINKSSKSIL